MRRAVQSLSMAFALFGAGTASSQAVTATAHVAIASGPNAGSYAVESTRADACSVGVDGRGVFSVRFGDGRAAADKFGGVQLVAPNPAASGSSQFMVRVVFGSALNRMLEYMVETRPTEPKLTGSGRVAIEDAGATASVTFYATTAAGIKLTGTVICKYVMRR